MRSGLSWPLLLRFRGPARSSSMTRCHCFGWGRGARASPSGAAGAQHVQQQEAVAPAETPPQLQVAKSPGPAKLPRTEAALQRPPGLGPSSPLAPPLRLTTFNLLADGLAQHGDFVNCTPEVLEWEYRLPRIVQEVAEAQPDILALQEANHFEEIAAALAPLGLTGHFLPKRPSPCERFGAPPDGVALFYRPERLAPLQGPQGLSYARPDGGGDMTQGFVAATLRDVATGRAMVVAATHLKAKEGAPNAETRRIQAVQLMQHVSAAAAAAAAAAGSGPVGVLVAGDLNDVPGSPACAALQGDGALSLTSIWDVPWAAAGDGQREGKQQKQQQQQNGAGKPAAGSNGNGGSSGSSSSDPPEFTTWKFRSGGEARRVIDHVFFSPAALVPASRWRMLSAEEIGVGGLPCARYPSDHVAVTAAFAWVQ